MKTVAVIVHWGDPEPTVELAARLNASPHVDQVAVVANDLAERPRAVPTGVAWLVPARDLGFGAGFRHAVDAYPAAEFYLLLKNDIELPDETIAACLRTLAATNIGVVAPTLVNDHGAQSGAAALSRLLAAPRALARLPRDRPCEASWVTGTIMFIKAECHRRAPMDGRYFLSFEDVDFCYRVRQAGWSVVVSPARARHTSGGPVPPGYAYYPIRNRLWFTRRQGWPARTALVALSTATVVLPRTAILDLLRRRGFTLSTLVLHGLLDGLGPLPVDELPATDEPRAARWSEWG